MAKRQSNEVYRLDLEVKVDASSGKSTPLRVDIDFTSQLGDRGSGRFIDPHTLAVKRRHGRSTRSYPVQFSDMLYLANRGWVAWLVDRPQEGGEWWIEFRLRAADGRLRDAPNRPMVGVGDELYLNERKWRPLDTPGYHPHVNAVDWTCDGLIDLVDFSHHSNAYRMPWEGFFCWRNIGSNQRPRFAPPIRIHALGDDGEPDFMDEWYTHYDVFDWFGTGRLDLITISRESGIKVYRNSGKLDGAGMPLLQHALTMERPACLAPGMYTNVRVVDWDGSGRPSVMLGTAFSDKSRHMSVEQVLLMRNRGKSPQGWKFETRALGVEYKSQLSRMIRPTGFWAESDGEVGVFDDYWGYTNFMGGRAVNFDLFDGDGKLEMLMGHPGQQGGPLYEVWRNIGIVEDPLMCYEGILPWSRSYSGVVCRFVKNEAFDGCLWAGATSGTGIHYFERTKKHYADSGGYFDKGPLLGQGAKLKIEGYGRPSPVCIGKTRTAWNTVGGKDFSLICGDEPGFITLARGAPETSGGSNGFALPEKLRDTKGQILHLNRERIIPDNDGERNCGQLKPVICDWDQDGHPDLIVGGNTRHIFWIERLDLKNNRYKALHRLAVRGVFNPFATRKGSAVVKFHGSRKPQLLTVDADGRVSLFRQGRGAKGRIELQPGV